MLILAVILNQFANVIIICIEVSRRNCLLRYNLIVKVECNTLKPISSLIKGEIIEPLAFNAFRKIMYEELAFEGWMREYFGEAAYINAGLGKAADNK